MTFGVVPSFPSTANGYIEQGITSGDGRFGVARFIEKPNADDTQALIFQGKALWNAGIFLVQASTLLEALQQHAGDILQSCQQAMEKAKQDQRFVRPAPEAFTACRADSIDHAVLELHKKVSVVPFAGAWSDVGSWNSVADLSPPDDEGNRIDGHGLAVQSQRISIHAPHRVVVLLGTQDLLVIDTPDALLVAASSHAEQGKSVVAQLETRKSPEAGLQCLGHSTQCCARVWTRNSL